MKLLIDWLLKQIYDYCLLQDVLEFVDCGCNQFLSNMCLVIASYNDMFLNKQDK